MAIDRAAHSSDLATNAASNFDAGRTRDYADGHDDLCNWLPARLSYLLMALMALVTPGASALKCQQVV
ncbi:MAG TPA: hypothetical protein EYQ18_10465 [Candidatus Handelsmanbacteria bacterium]|nr:hypothetical protein [Candidatus Handelsmanbacteria bacterium]